MIDPQPEGQMASYIQRRKFLATLGGAAAAWPLAARAQQPIGKIRHLGILLPGLPTSSLGKATWDRLRELGYTEGRDIILETRWAEGKVDRLTELAAELASLKVDAIITFSTPAAIAARKATTTIPIIFVYVGDPVGAGVVPSLAREAQDAAAKLGVTIHSIGVHDLIDFDPAFARIESGRIDALLTLVDPFTSQHRKRIV